MPHQRGALPNPYDGTTGPTGPPDHARSRALQRALALGAMTTGLGFVGVGVALADSEEPIPFGDTSNVGPTVPARSDLVITPWNPSGTRPPSIDLDTLLEPSAQIDDSAPSSATPRPVDPSDAIWDTVEELVPEVASAEPPTTPQRTTDVVGNVPSGIPASSETPASTLPRVESRSGGGTPFRPLLAASPPVEPGLGDRLRTPTSPNGVAPASRTRVAPTSPNEVTTTRPALAELVGPPSQIRLGASNTTPADLSVEIRPPVGPTITIEEPWKGTAYLVINGQKHGLAAGTRAAHVELYGGAWYLHPRVRGKYEMYPSAVGTTDAGSEDTWFEVNGGTIKPTGSFVEYK